MGDRNFKIILIGLVVAAALFCLSSPNIVGLVASLSDVETSQNNTFETGEVLVNVTSPDGGETWSVGTPYDITWTSDPSPPEWASEVDIWLSTDSGNTWSYLIADSTDNDGVHHWTPTYPYGSNCRIKVVARGYGSWMGRDRSDSDFSISE